MPPSSSAFVQGLIIFCALGWLLWSGSVVLAQTEPDAQIKSQEIRKQALPEPRAADEKDDEEEDELGKLLALKRAKSWSVTPSVSARGFYTSNAFLSNKGEKGDTIFMETQGVTAGYRFSRDWQLQADYSFQLTRYDENSFLDTDAHSTGLRLLHQFDWDWTVEAGLRGLWLTTPHGEVEVYRENNPYLVFTHSHGFLDDKLNWFYGLQYDHKFTHPVSFERNEYSLFSGVSYYWLPNLVSQLVLRQNWQFYDFRPPANPVNGRQEWISTVGLQTVWQPLSWLQVSGFGFTTYDNSVNAGRDYKVANLGGEIRVFWKF